MRNSHRYAAALAVMLCPAVAAARPWTIQARGAGVLVHLPAIPIGGTNGNPIQYSGDDPRCPRLIRESTDWDHATVWATPDSARRWLSCTAPKGGNS